MHRLARLCVAASACYSRSFSGRRLANSGQLTTKQARASSGRGAGHTQHEQVDMVAHEGRPGEVVANPSRPHPKARHNGAAEQRHVETKGLASPADACGSPHGECSPPDAFCMLPGTHDTNLRALGRRERVLRWVTGSGASSMLDASPVRSPCGFTARGGVLKV